MNNNKSIKISIIISNIALGLLIALVIALPWLVSWYVEVKGRSATLPTTILVTCYPCAPFVGASLVFLKKLLKNILNSKDYQKNENYFKYICWCCVTISVITLIGGKFYLPFFIVALTFAFLALLTFSFLSVYSNLINKNEDK